VTALELGPDTGGAADSVGERNAKQLAVCSHAEETEPAEVAVSSDARPTATPTTIAARATIMVR
jgi:hypothetical protein